MDDDEIEKRVRSQFEKILNEKDAAYKKLAADLKREKLRNKFQTVASGIRDLMPSAIPDLFDVAADTLSTYSEKEQPRAIEQWINGQRTIRHYCFRAPENTGAKKTKYELISEANAIKSPTARIDFARANGLK